MSNKERNDLTPIGSIIPDVLKEVDRRCQLRARLQAERGREVTDEEFLVIADQTGMKL